MRLTLTLVAAAILAAAPAEGGNKFAQATASAEKVRSLRSTVSSDERKVSASKVKQLEAELRNARERLKGLGSRLEHGRKSSLDSAVAGACKDMQAAGEAVSAWRVKFEKGTSSRSDAEAAQESLDDALEAWIDLRNELQRSKNEIVTDEAKLKSRAENNAKRAEDLRQKRIRADARADAEFDDLKKAYDKWKSLRAKRIEVMNRCDRIWGELQANKATLSAAEFERLQDMESNLNTEWRSLRSKEWTAKGESDRADAAFDKTAEAAHRAEQAHLAFLRSKSNLETMERYGEAAERLRRFRGEFGDV